MRVREARAYERYKKSNMHSLYDAYSSFSQSKRYAWRYCQDLCNKLNGHGLKVISKNTNEFTAGFVFEEDGVQKFMYITKTSDTVAEIGKEEE